MAKFKVLMYGGAYVDVRSLTDGIYATDKPELYPADSTIEAYAVKAENVAKETQINIRDYVKNLRKCSFVDCDMSLTIDSSAPALDAGFFEDVRKLVDYDWNSEEADFEQQEDRDAAEVTHIYPVLKRLDDGLKRIGK